VGRRLIYQNLFPNLQLTPLCTLGKPDFPFGTRVDVEDIKRVDRYRLCVCIVLQVWRVRRRAAVRDDRDAAEAGQCVNQVSSIVECRVLI
jgi:hypothetical protein